VQCHAGIHRDALNHSRTSSVSNWPTLSRGNVTWTPAPPVPNVDHDARQRLVHRHVDRGIAGDAGHVAKRLLQRPTKRDANILGRVVVIDVKVADRLDRDVDAGCRPNRSSI